MADIFVSYRAADSAYVAAELYSTLVERFGPNRAFLDWSSMPPGTVYPATIRAAVERSRVVLAVIGPHWLTEKDASGRRRIDDPGDWVRQELASAFRNGIPVVPVILDGARLPASQELPEDVRMLALSQWARVRLQALRTDLADLAAQLERVIPELAPPPLSSARGAQPAYDMHNGVRSSGTKLPRPRKRKRGKRHARPMGRSSWDGTDGQERPDRLAPDVRYSQQNDATHRGSIYANQGPGSVNINHYAAARPGIRGWFGVSGWFRVRGRSHHPGKRQFRVSGWLGVSGWFFVTMLLVDVSYLVWYSYLYSVTADFHSVVEHDFRGLTLGFVASCFGISLVLAWFLPIDIVYMARWCFGLLFALVSSMWPFMAVRLCGASLFCWPSFFSPPGRCTVGWAGSTSLSGCGSS